MKTATAVATTIVLLLLLSCPAGASIFQELAAISIIREQSADFGYDASAYSDEELRSLVRAIPKAELEEFCESYARRPNVGTPLTAVLEAVNRAEFKREKQLLEKWVSVWERNRQRSQSTNAHRGESEDMFAFFSP